jgi:spore germination cell wall hydrolase CwlJ-like protein
LAVGWCLNEVIQKKFSHLRESLNFGEEKVITAKERERQLECLAINIYREAGNEPFEGKVGVAQVTLNRAESSQFPKDVCGVVYQKNVFIEKVVCQFSWYCDSTHRNRPINKEAYNESYEVAKKVLLENFRLPSLTDALYYHADYVNPGWKLERITKIGRHIFYKPKGTKNA